MDFVAPTTPGAAARPQTTLQTRQIYSFAPTLLMVICRDVAQVWFHLILVEMPIDSATMSPAARINCGDDSSFFFFLKIKKFNQK
jgi:hypothetical protein